MRALPFISVVDNIMGYLGLLLGLKDSDSAASSLQRLLLMKELSYPAPLLSSPQSMTAWHGIIKVYSLCPTE